MTEQIPPPITVAEILRWLKSSKDAAYTVGITYDYSEESHGYRIEIDSKGVGISGYGGVVTQDVVWCGFGGWLPWRWQWPFEPVRDFAGELIVRHCRKGNWYELERHKITEAEYDEFVAIHAELLAHARRVNKRCVAAVILAAPAADTTPPEETPETTEQTECET